MGLVLAACTAVVMSAAPAAATTECRLFGSWEQTTEQVGSTTWVIDEKGNATERGIGNATGHATLANNVLTIDWTTSNGYAGTYRWDLNASCGGTGELTFTKVGQGDDRKGKSYKSTVKGPAPHEVFPAGPKVTIAGVDRKVEVSRNASGWEPATAGMQLANGDRVHTGFKAGVILNYPDGSRLIVGPMTLLQLTNTAVGPEGGIKARVWLKLGEVSAQVNRSTGARGDFEVKTPTTTASVRGTKFSVAYDGSATTVAVTESSVEVTSNSGAKVVVPAGMETRSTARSVSPPVAIGQGFKSGGLSSAQALARLTSKLSAGLSRCKFGVVSNRLAPVAGGWRAQFVIVGAKQGIKAKPKGTARFRLKGRKVSPGNALARRIAQGCR
jgi:hypothetical protein